MDSTTSQNHAIDVNPLHSDDARDIVTDSLIPKESDSDSSDLDKELWHTRAQRIALVSICFNSFVFIAVLVMSVMTNSTALLVLSVAILVDTLDDLVALWRFFCDPHGG